MKRTTTEKDLLARTWVVLRYLTVIVFATFFYPICIAAEFEFAGELTGEERSLLHSIADNGILTGYVTHGPLKSLHPKEGRLGFVLMPDSDFHVLDKVPIETVLGRTAEWPFSETFWGTNFTVSSGDGTAIAGTTTVVSYNSTQTDANSIDRAFRWSEDAGVQPLGALSGHIGTESHGISHDGSTIVGDSRDYQDDIRRTWGPHWLIPTEQMAVRWTSAGVQELATPNEYPYSSAAAASHDGKVITGTMWDSYNFESGVSVVEGQRAVRWSEESGVAMPLDAQLPSRAVDISGDGSVIVGTAWQFDELGRVTDPRPFRWTDSSGLQLLELETTWTNGVTSDGTIVFGDIRVDNRFNGYLWSERNGTVDIRDVLEDHGLTDSTKRLEGVRLVDISADKRTLIGLAFRQGQELAEGWIARLNRPVLATSGILGDFDDDYQIDADDLDLLSAETARNRYVELFDVNSDSIVDFEDRTHWIHELARTFFGDANLDGEFNQIDVVAVLQADQFNDNIPLNSTWATGDWDGDGDFTNLDIVTALQDGGYRTGPLPAVSAVPEPTSMLMIVLAMMTLLGTARQSCSRCWPARSSTT